MARSYEYVIHGPPLTPSSTNNTPHKSLSTKQHHRRRDSDLRNLYRDAQSPQDIQDEWDEPAKDSFRISDPATPNLPPTPPTPGDIDHEFPTDVASQEAEGNRIVKGTSVPMAPTTPVQQQSPPTPDLTPPRAYTNLSVRPLITLQPSIASTRAESFRTAREDIPSDDDFTASSYGSWTQYPFESATQIVSNSLESRAPLHKSQDDHLSDENACPVDPHNLLRAPSVMNADEKRSSELTVIPTHESHQSVISLIEVHAADDPADPSGQEHNIERTEHQPAQDTGSMSAGPVQSSSTSGPGRSRTLRERLQTARTERSSSTDAFASVIGWNDGGIDREERSATNLKRWSGVSNISAVEAYVVDSPIKPSKRGTLRKVIKNDSLRSTSLPLPNSNRTSLQSNGSPHRLVHKKQKLNNEHRWSISSDVSQRSLSWGSGPILPSSELMTVPPKPETQNSSRSSISNNRQYSSLTAPGAARALFVQSASALKASTAPPSEDAASILRHDLTREQNASVGQAKSIPELSTQELSRPASPASQQFCQQQEQAEKDLRSTLDRMESERLSSSLRRGSDETSSPTPAPRVQSTSGPNVSLLVPVASTTVLRKNSSAGASTHSKQKSVTIEAPEIEPGTKDWADLRPPTLASTPFSQRSGMSTSPEIIEARAVSFFPHNNKSIQLIEPNRLSETPAVRTLREENLRRPATAPTLLTQAPKTPPTAAQLSSGITTDSPLRNPRKPPQPPQVRFPNGSMLVAKVHTLPPEFTPESSPEKYRNSGFLRRRPSLQDGERSQSFIKSLGRNISLRNTKNPKQHQSIDAPTNPFWRPEPFWDDEDYRRRQQQERETGVIVKDPIALPSSRTVTILEPDNKLSRSNSIAAGPMSLIRRISERRQQRRRIDDHIASQQALVKQSSYSSLQRFQAGRRLYGLPPLRSISLNMGIGRLSSLRDKMTSMRERRDDQRREHRRDKLRKSIGNEVVMTGDSRFPSGIQHSGGYKVPSDEAISQLLADAQAEGVVGKRGLRM